MGKQHAILAGAMALAGAVALYRGRIRPWMYTWGAEDDEVTATLPGDELVEPTTYTTTRAVTIQARVEDVWPWLAQIGEARGGFYSYWLLERAAGADIHNAATVHPEWQDLEVGDTVWLARRYGDIGRQTVAAVAAGSHLVLMSPDDFDRVRRGEKASGAWSFHLRPVGAWSRLIIRGNGGVVGHLAFDVPHFVMERKMMLGIRARAEHLGREQRTATGERRLPAGSSLN